MICYLVTQKHTYTIGSFIKSWGSEFARRFVVVPYEYVLAGNALPLANTSFVFSDMDRLSEAQREQLVPLHQHLVNQLGAGRVLNHPTGTLLRLDMLHALHENGINHFNAQRVSDGIAPRRYPVFIRGESGFEMDDLPLLAEQDSYNAAVESLKTEQRPLSDTLAVEFVDTADAHGIYRKYGAFVVGDRIVPRHLFFSRNWMVKLADLHDPALLAEECAYIDDNPHEQALLAATRLAGASYGRIDYSMHDGQPQIWEINTNPMIASAISSVIPARRQAHLKFVQKFGVALDGVDGGGEEMSQPQ